MLSWVFVGFALVCSAEAVTHSTRLGDLEGQVLSTPSGREFHSFTGIPFAKPPLGELRLKNPVPHGSWASKLDATKVAPMCTQVYFFIPSLRNITMGQEDCLYLNIFTPTLDTNRKLPVLVYVHGGGFRCGSPGTPVRATKLMEKDVVLVTVQYRLGLLGFLSTEDPEIPGNYGLKDQALALKWVHENIDQFGGDPSRIVAFGESAGGASVHYLLTSPLSRDYLQGAIAESGLIDAPWARGAPGKERGNAQKVAEIVGCDINSNFLECLQKIDATKLTRVEEEFLVWDFDPAIVFQPVIEVENDGAFMTTDLREEKINKPLITGITTGEGLIKTSSLVNQDDSVLDEFINRIDEILPELMLPSSSSHRIKEFTATIKNRYFNNLGDRNEVIQGIQDRLSTGKLFLLNSAETERVGSCGSFPFERALKKVHKNQPKPEDCHFGTYDRCHLRLYRDLFFAYPLHLLMERHSGPVYGYVFHHRGENSLADLTGPKKMNSDLPCHVEEILSIFNWTVEFPNTKGTDEDKAVSNRMVNYWTNFAEHLNPTPEGSLVKWEQYSNGRKVLHIGTNEDHMGPYEMTEVIEFCHKVFKILSTPAASSTVKSEL